MSVSPNDSTNIPGTGGDPALNNLDYYLRAWYEANKLWDADNLALQNAITHMLTLAKEGKMGEAFQAAEHTVMPGAMTLQGDSMGQLAASMNVASASQEFTTDAQNAINGGKKMTIAQAKAFVKALQDMYNTIKAEMNLPKKDQWMDQATAQNMLNAIDKTCSPFAPIKPINPNFNPNDLDPAKVQADIIKWVTNPDVQPTNGKTGQQNLQDLQSGLTQWNNTESAQSQGLQAQEQFASNTYNQYMNTCVDIFQATQKQIQDMVQNQKS